MTDRRLTEAAQKVIVYLASMLEQHRVSGDGDFRIARELCAPTAANLRTLLAALDAMAAERDELERHKRNLITMLEEEAYHRMAAESRAQPDSGNVRIEVTDTAELATLRARLERAEATLDDIARRTNDTYAERIATECLDAARGAPQGGTT